MAQYEICSYDLFGSDEEGYEVNDVYKLGTIELSDNDVNVDAELVLRLQEEDYFDEDVTVDDLHIDGMDTIYIDKADYSQPLYELRPVD